MFKTLQIYNYKSVNIREIALGVGPDIGTYLVTGDVRKPTSLRYDETLTIKDLMTIAERNIPKLLNTNHFNKEQSIILYYLDAQKDRLQQYVMDA